MLKNSLRLIMKRILNVVLISVAQPRGWGWLESSPCAKCDVIFSYIYINITKRFTEKNAKIIQHWGIHSQIPLPSAAEGFAPLHSKFLALPMIGIEICTVSLLLCAINNKHLNIPNHLFLCLRLAKFTNFNNIPQFVVLRVLLQFLVRFT